MSNALDLELQKFVRSHAGAENKAKFSARALHPRSSLQVLGHLFFLRPIT